MTRAYRKQIGPRIPSASGELQLNSCRNVLCENFGVAPTSMASRWAATGSKDPYVVTQGNQGRVGGVPTLNCQACKTTMTLLNNHAIVEERDRLLSLSKAAPLGACRNESCENAGLDVRDHPAAYPRFGKTAIGSPRYRCRLCRRTFSTVISSTHRLRHPTKTVEIFRCLINKVAMRRMCEIVDVGAETLYQRIGLIYEKCRAFAAEHEAPLLAGTLVRERIHLAVDRQEYTLNSGTAIDRRPSILLAIASAEAYSGYIVAQHLNFDPDADPFALELAAREAGDLDVPPAFRRYGRLWLPH